MLAFSLMPGVGSIALAVVPFPVSVQAPPAREDTDLQQEPVASVQLLDNGDFTELLDPALNPVKLLPWWKTGMGPNQVVPRGGARWLGTMGEHTGVQPLAAYLPLAGRTRLCGRVAGPGVITITDGRGKQVRIAIEASDVPAEDGREFELTLAELAGDLAGLEARGMVVRGDLAALAQPTPRFVLEFSSESENQPAWWTDLEAWVSMPCPGEAALRAEIVRELRWIVERWEARMIDAETGFACYRHDVVTGERLATRDGGLNPVFTLLADATEVEPDARWIVLYERFLESWFGHCLHPETGLPRTWDVAGGRGRDERPVEIAHALGFLIDLAESGPEPWRERAREHALVIGEHVLARGVLPDGNVAPGYRPGDGQPLQQYSNLRRFDVPAELARLGAWTGDARFAEAAREAVVTFEYTWMWAGSWPAIDPGFDDNYGHYGARALVMWREFPEDPMFRRVALGGYEFFAPLWRDALRLGGNVAADQVRCWELVAELSELEPDVRAEVTELLGAAARVHFKGEQYENGAWGDVTIFDFDPKAGLQVGDLPGVPQNLLHGLALIYDERFGSRDEATRAMFTTVMRSSIREYRRPFGYLLGRRERAGLNPSGGSLRLAVGLVEMLRRLSR